MAKVKFELNNERARLVKKFFSLVGATGIKQFYTDYEMQEYGADECINAVDLILDKINNLRGNERDVIVDLTDKEIYSFTEYLNCLVKEEIQEVFEATEINQEVRECNDAFWSMYTVLKKL